MTMDYGNDQDMVVLKGTVTPTYGYYRQPNGWITVSVVTPIEELKYREEGWEPLKQYGRFDMGNAYAANHPLESLFMHGGAHELSVAQVVEMGLYMDPPLIPTCRQPIYQYHTGHKASCWVGAKRVEFPQLQGISELGPFPCTMCERKLPTKKARDQHESVAHKDEKGNIRTGEVLAAGIVQGLQGSAVSVPPDVTAALEKIGLLPRQRKALIKMGVIAKANNDRN